MHASKTAAPLVALFALCLAAAVPAPAAAEEIDSSIAACLKAWGEHPFGKTPQFKTMGTSFKVFGIGNDISDTAPTPSPALVLIEPNFNLMGASTIALLNPNGWYCMRTTVNLLGQVTVRAHCKARLAGASDGSVALANESANRSFKDLTVTVVGTVEVERPCT